MNVLDLFSGIGGFSLGLERAGMRTIAFCEIDPFCRRVLAKHWPNVPIYDDVRTLTGERLRADGIIPDVICGGFPCQDISTAGKGAGIDGERSGLWTDYARLIGDIRPSYAIVENVAALLGRGLERVLGDLAALRFDAEWHCIPASGVGAPHRRDRVWVLARNTNGKRISSLRSIPGGQETEHCRSSFWHCPGSDTNSAGLEEWRGENTKGAWANRWPIVERSRVPYPTHYAALSDGIRRGDSAGQWRIEPDVGRVAHGVSNRVDRLRGLGNAVVPQIPEIIGRAIMSVRHK